MLRLSCALCACLLLGCGGGDVDDPTAHPDAQPADYVPADILESAQSEAERVCLLSGYIGMARIAECGFEPYYEPQGPASEAEILENCATKPPDAQPSQSQEACLDYRAQAACDDLVGSPLDNRCFMVHESQLQ